MSMSMFKVRESDGREVNSAMKNNIEGIIIKWTHQVIVMMMMMIVMLMIIDM